MKSWIRRTLLGVFGATIVLGGLTACGHRYDHHGAGMTAEERAKFRDKAIERVSSKLDLNADQKQKLATLADKLQAQRTAVMGSADPRAEVKALVAGEKFDRARAQAFISQKTTAVNSASPEVIAALGDFYDSLNPQQQTKVREFMDRGRRGWWRS